MNLDHVPCRREAVFEDRGGVPVLRMTTAGDWDTGDLTLVGAAASRAGTDGRGRIGLDLSGVGRLPGGFLSLLLSWHDRGLEVLLFDPPPHVRGMHWFRRFADPMGGAWRLADVPRPTRREERSTEPPWEDESRPLEPRHVGRSETRRAAGRPAGTGRASDERSR